MKRIILALALLGICKMGMAQVQDNAVIPVSVTINSVLRLQVNSGGNIQFVFNTMNQFSGGITNTSNTTTKFTVSSSRPYKINLSPENSSLIGLTTSGNADLGLLQYTVDTGPGIKTPGTQPLANGSTEIVDNSVPASNENYDLKWEAGTGSVKATGIPPDTYVTNVFLTLVPY